MSVAFHVGMRRLLKLADYLRKVKKRDFNMSHWSGPPNPWDSGVNCGTTACAMGYACHIPSFKRAGLKLVPYPGTLGERGECYPAFDGANEFDAAAKFFGISHQEASYLFNPMEYCGYGSGRVKNITPQIVAKRIRHYVRDRVEGAACCGKS